jgi:hypothetical protein
LEADVILTVPAVVAVVDALRLVEVLGGAVRERRVRRWRDGRRSVSGRGRWESHRTS